MIRIRYIHAAFVLSGIAGLMYEVLWSRYLSLFVGHSAYAQVLVLAVYLGGMAVGSVAIARFSERTPRPFFWYAGAEAVLCAFGLVFHPLFTTMTGWAYDSLFPAVGSAHLVGSLRWALAGVLILPQAVVLGTTFPLMAAGLVRSDVGHPGGAVARAYFLNTIGGAAGVLLAGFWLIGALGLAGTSVAAAGLNASVALLVWTGIRGGAGEGGALPGTKGRTGAEGPAAHAGTEAWSPGIAALLRVMLVVSFGTALASFAYEIGWIRMLSLVLGSATHAFELMLSAFILGIAVGARAIRQRTDRSGDPVRLLARIQVGMGLFALASLPVYLGTFPIMSELVPALSGRAGGYALFNLTRYGLCLAVMLPSTVLAGAALPVLVAALLRAGAGERTIGLAYGVNTLGAVVGAGVAGLVALPLLGLKGLIMAGSAVDVLLGLWLFERSARWTQAKLRTVGWGLAGSAVAFLLIGALVHFDPTTIASGVFRRGTLPTGDQRVSLYYQDGRTATVSAHLGIPEGLIVLATNGKPDASMDSRWVYERRDTLPIVPVPTGRDFTTQILAPMSGLAHNPGARTVANIGHGSGMTAASLLSSPRIERLVTIEIEPLMVEGSLAFLPANERAFSDPRASFVFDDAKSYFAYSREPFDLIFAEPSNPWVSGTSSLFTREFYRRAADVLSDGGVLAQWVQLYEIDDDLLLSIIAALADVFPNYRGYMVGDGDVAIVASRSALPEADWSALETPGFRELTVSAPPFLPQHLVSELLFDQETFRPLVEAGIEPNSDYRPILDTGAERTRFEQHRAEGVLDFGVARVDLVRYLDRRAGLPVRDTVGFSPFELPPARGLIPSVLHERGSWLREILDAGGGIAPEAFPDWQNEIVGLREFLSFRDLRSLLDSWEAWSGAFVSTEGVLHWGTAGAVDSTFYAAVDRFVEANDAPPEARATVELLRSYQLGDWAGVAEAVDVVLEPVGRSERWVPPELLLDLAVPAYLEAGRPQDARQAADLLVPLTNRTASNARNRLLRALADGG